MSQQLGLWACHQCKVAIVLLAHEGEIMRDYNGNTHPHNLRKNQAGGTCRGDIGPAPDVWQTALIVGGKEAVEPLLPVGWELAG